MRVVEFDRNGGTEPISGSDDEARKLATEAGADLDVTENVKLWRQATGYCRHCRNHFVSQCNPSRPLRQTALFCANGIILYDLQ